MCRLLAVFSFLLLFQNVWSQRLKQPVGYTVLSEADGDLDGDGLPEKVIVYNTPDTNAETSGIRREIILYKRDEQEWIPWHRSTKAILDSQSGGMMGDPFQEVSIEKGILLILQAGGSSWKWDRLDKYRFQNNRFELIGYKSEFGKHCEEWTVIDYNLSTGMIQAKKTYDRCDESGEAAKAVKQEKESFKHKLSAPIHLGNRNDFDTKIVSPKYKFELYL